MSVYGLLDSYNFIVLTTTATGRRAHFDKLQNAKNNSSPFLQKAQTALGCLFQLFCLQTPLWYIPRGPEVLELLLLCHTGLLHQFAFYECNKTCKRYKQRDSMREVFSIHFVLLYLPNSTFRFRQLIHTPVSPKQVLEKMTVMMNMYNIPMLSFQ